MKNKKLIAIIAILTVLTLSLGYINIKSVNKASGEEGMIGFVSGEGSARLSFDEITGLGSKEFKAVEDTSASGPASRKFKGVLLKDVLNKISISDETIKSSSKIIVKGSDGYVLALSPDEVLADNGVYLAYEKNGKPLGNMKNGGSGPFQLIAVSDSFSQRWCKYVVEVVLE